MNLRKTFVEVDLSAIAHNLDQYSKALPEAAGLMAVVKADGYGHGAVEVAQKAVACGVDFLGVALVEEGIELREAGINARILILGSWPAEGLPYFQEYTLTPTIHSLASARALDEYSKEKGIKQMVHLKVDTGMGRLGMSESELIEFLEADFSQLDIEGASTHLSKADETDKSYSERQLNLFQNYMSQITERYNPTWIHVANSAGTTDLSGPRGNLFRIGIGMYGQQPSNELLTPPDLKQAICYKSSVVQLKWFKKGHALSYGGTFITEKDTKVAVLSVGYADGYSRLLSNQADVLIRGKRARVLGRVCMDMTLVDCTDIEDAALGDEVVLIGKQGDEEILAMELADIMGTINYEITCNISKRVPRYYLNG